MAENKLNFILEGKEYSAAYDADGDVENIYSFSDNRYLAYDSDKGDRERPHVWVAAYAMADY